MALQNIVARMKALPDNWPGISSSLLPDMRASAGAYRHHRVLLLTCVRGKGALGTTTVKREGLASLATQFGLHPVDRYLSRLPKSQQCRLVLTSGSMYIEHGTTAAAGTLLPLDQSWAKAVSDDGACLLLLALGELTDLGFEQLVRRATSTSRCMGAVIDVLDARPVQDNGHEPFVTIGPHGGARILAHERACAVLDSNVVINLEKAALGHLGSSPRAIESLQSLMATLVHRDVRPGFAISETLYSMPPHVDRAARRASLRAAIDSWFDHGMDGVVDVQDLGERYRERYSDLRSQPIEPLEALDGSGLFSITYPSLLKLDELWRRADRFRARQRVDLFREYCRFVDEEIRYVSAQTLQIAVDVLLGRGPMDYLTQLLKPGKPNRTAILRGAAWDLLFLFVPELAESGRFDLPAGRTVLVTADRALPGLRRRMAFRGMARAPGSESSIVDLTIDIDSRLDPQRPEIDEMLDDLKISIGRRFGEGQQKLDVDRLGRLITILEARADESSRRGEADTAEPSSSASDLP